MITASIRFLTNSLIADLTCRASDLQNNLQSMGVLTPLNLITLDNARTLQIHLTPMDEIGEHLCSVVNPEKDTLGSVQRLCRHIYCMNGQHRAIFVDKLENGEIKTIQQGIKFAEKMREAKKAEQYR